MGLARAKCVVVHCGVAEAKMCFSSLWGWRGQNVLLFTVGLARPKCVVVHCGVAEAKMCFSSLWGWRGQNVL